MTSFTEKARRASTPAELARILGDAPGVMLSASVPYRRTFPPDLQRNERARRFARNEHYLKTMQPQRVRSSVVQLARAIWMRGARLVFGAHPAISPLLLLAARDMSVAEGSVVIFQSAWFEEQIPKSTLALADWHCGVPVLTPRVAKNAELTGEQASLLRMRELMLSVPGLVGAVFIGGMEGVEEEARMFRHRHPDLPCYALASTGSAARDLLQDVPDAYRGRLTDHKALLTSRSYSLVAKLIAEDLGLMPPVPRDRP